MPRSLLALLASITVWAVPAVAQNQSTTVFVVRHAEKGPEQPDPSLTPAGTARATTLTGMLRDAHITAVFATQFKRTQETVAPVAAQAGIQVQVIDAGKTDALIASIRALPAGSRAVVASHSNVVPSIVEKLTGEKVGELTDADYDRLFIVTIRPDGTGSVVMLHYGMPSPSGTAPMRE